MKRLILGVALSLISLVASAQQAVTTANTQATKYNQWLQGTGVQTLYGAYPNVGEYYDGTNFIVDILHGGGKTSFPDGIIANVTGNISGTITATGMTTFSSGAAVTTTAYQVGRDNGGTNALHFNVPTGATGIFSVNGTSKVTFDTNGMNGVIGGTTPAAVTGTTITANTGFVGPLNGIIGGVTPAAVTGTTITANTGFVGPLNGIIGGVTPAAGAFTTIAGNSTITSSSATTIGWSLVAGANTACTTTCTNACVFGQDTATFAIVDCANAIADVCVCAGAN